MSTTSMKAVTRSSQSKRDCAVELLRIFAILLVIGTHCKQAFFIGDQVSTARVVIGCLVSDGVGFFFAITGMFFCRQANLNKASYLKTLKTTFKKCFVPLLLFSVFGFYLFDWLIGGASIVDSISKSPADYKELIVVGLLHWEVAVPFSPHLWYLYVYMLVMFCMPAYWGLFRFIDKGGKNSQIALLAILFALLILNDYYHNDLFQFSHTRFNGVLGASVFVILGHVLYSNKDVFKSNWLFPAIGLVAAVLAIVSRSVVMMGNPDYTHPLQWYTSWGFVVVTGFTIFVLGTVGKHKFSAGASKAICHVGSMVFYVYLFHLVVLFVANNFGFADTLSGIFGTTALGSIGYVAVFTLFVFFATLALSEIIMIPKKVISAMTRRKSSKPTLRK